MASKSNGIETYDGNVTLVSNPKYLPYKYIPYESYARARVNHPDDMLYIYEGAPAGFKIVAFPLTLNRPDDCKDHKNCEEADVE